MGPHQDIWVLRGTFFVCGSTFLSKQRHPKQAYNSCIVPKWHVTGFSSGGRDFGAASVRASKFRFEMNSCQPCCWCMLSQVSIRTKILECLYSLKVRWQRQLSVPFLFRTSGKVTDKITKLHMCSHWSAPQLGLATLWGYYFLQIPRWHSEKWLLQPS